MTMIRMLLKCVSIWFIVLVSSNSAVMIDPLDFLALQYIRKSLNDLPGSNFFANWDFSSDPCKFTGVICVYGKVVALNLGEDKAGSPGLTGQLNPGIGNLKELAELTLVPGKVMGSIPSSLSRCQNLRFLGISRNLLSGTIPASLGLLRNLHGIDLSNNLLAGPIPDSFGALPGLVNVILNGNRLSGPLPPFLSTNLSRFEAKNNLFSGPLFENTLPTSLQYLSLSGNTLSGPISTLLIKFENIIYLDLSINRFTGDIPGKVFSFPLIDLQLQKNKFSGPVRPDAQVIISNVDLSYNQLSEEISPMFSTVENLYLNNNKFSGEVPASFVEKLLAGSTKILYLHQNYLTGISINQTAEIPKSSSLCLQYNCMVPPVQMTCPAEAGLEKTRPPEQCPKQG